MMFDVKCVLQTQNQFENTDPIILLFLRYSKQLHSIKLWIQILIILNYVRFIKQINR